MFLVCATLLAPSVPLPKSLFVGRSFFRSARPAQLLCADRGRGTGAVRKRLEMNEKLLSELSARLAALAKDNPAKDLQKNFRALLAGAFERLDLVSREEYDVQAQVLARAREKLAALERRVAELEAKRR